MSAPAVEFGRETKTFAGQGVTKYGYDATVSKNRRQAPSGRLTSEDTQLQAGPRARLTSAGRDIQRNFAIAAFAIRKHLDYVANHRFQARTGNDKLAPATTSSTGSSKNSLHGGAGRAIAMRPAGSRSKKWCAWPKSGG